MQIPFWRDSPGVWDELVLGGKVWPGLAKISVKGGQQIDVKKAPGAHGASITYKGYEPKDVSIVLRVWTKEQWEELQRRMPDIEPTPGKQTLDPLDISHPKTKLRKVKAIAIKDIEGPDESSIRNCYELKIAAIEFFPPLTKKKATTTPARSLVDALNSTPLSKAGPIIQGLYIPIDPTNESPLIAEERERAQKAAAEEEKKVVSWADGTKSVGPKGKHFTEPSKTESKP